MNNVILLHFEPNIVRAVVQGGAPWFALRDLCTALGIDRRAGTADRLGEDEKAVAEVGTPGGERTAVVVVSLSGLYAVAASAERAAAGRFRRWITADVLPSIMSPVSAAVLPQRPPGGMHATSEIAEALGVRPAALGRWIGHLKTERHGVRRPAVGRDSGAVVDQWWWNDAGRDAVLSEVAGFADCRN